MLHITDLHAFYGKSHVLHGVHFDVGQGEIVALRRGSLVVNSSQGGGSKDTWIIDEGN